MFQFGAPTGPQGTSVTIGIQPQQSYQAGGPPAQPFAPAPMAPPQASGVQQPQGNSGYNFAPPGPAPTQTAPPPPFQTPQPTFPIGPTPGQSGFSIPQQPGGAPINELDARINRMRQGGF